MARAVAGVDGGVVKVGRVAIVQLKDVDQVILDLTIGGPTGRGEATLSTEAEAGVGVALVSGVRDGEGYHHATTGIDGQIGGDLVNRFVPVAVAAKVEPTVQETAGVSRGGDGDGRHFTRHEGTVKGHAVLVVGDTSGVVAVGANAGLTVGFGIHGAAQRRISRGQDDVASAVAGVKRRVGGIGRVAIVHSIETSVPGPILLARVQSGDDGLSSDRVGIAIETVVAALILGCEGVTRCRRKDDIVVTRQEVGKAIVAASVGRRSSSQHACASVQGDGHTRHTRLTSLLDAIEVRVLPHVIAQRGWDVETCVPGPIPLGRFQGGDNGLTSGPVGVAVETVVAALILERDGVGRRRVKDDVVITRDEPGKTVVAAGVGRGGG